jgi:maltose phosphorylase
MREKFVPDEWSIVEEGFDPTDNRFSESIFSLGNEHMGLRGNFEERYSGDSLRGTYMAGLYYPDKTRVGWWKNGYPEFFAKVINSTNWIGIDIELEDLPLDLAQCEVREFRRVLDMRNGTLTRSFTAKDAAGRETAFEFRRFLSMARGPVACVTVRAEPLNWSGAVAFTPYLDGNVRNEDSNYGERFWEEVSASVSDDEAVLVMRTKATPYLERPFCHAAACSSRLLLNDSPVDIVPEPVRSPAFAGQRFTTRVKPGLTVTLEKIVAVCTSRDYEPESLPEVTLETLRQARNTGVSELFREHLAVMTETWDRCDVRITGDAKAQQGIRYNIFQLVQTYTGKDPRLNLGPKGFTGEKYGGCTYWDTEAFCFPFYLYTDEAAARALLFYRYLHLPRAKENAAKLGLPGALYPMVTIDGRECHNEWEITFEEIHRNGAIAYAICRYTEYTGDRSYLERYGIEVLAELSRFWAGRVTYNPRKDRYMILGVTGPNEYENNVNNNWYTNLMASWTLSYTLESLESMRTANPERYRELSGALGITEDELECWRGISERMYFPEVKDLGIWEQQDGYMDKELLTVADIPREELPLNRHWSWDRILRSCFIKQADVIQGLYFFPELADRETVRRNFDFYEPRTVHESSLSASVHSVVASRIGYREKAYELYLRTARLDLDDYNADTDEGVHLTSMAGSWLAIVQGFAGLSVKDGALRLEPYLPAHWTGYSFQLTFRARRLRVSVTPERVTVDRLSGDPLSVVIFGSEHRLDLGGSAEAPLRTGRVPRLSA